jgi:hypothetical protein
MGHLTGAEPTREEIRLTDVLAGILNPTRSLEAAEQDLDSVAAARSPSPEWSLSFYADDGDVPEPTEDLSE